ncbi:hypothetical protein Tco_0500797 [Tanacetum coccineum]
MANMCSIKRVTYGQSFTLVGPWRLLRKHKNWQELEMPKFCKTIESALKKSKISKTTSHTTSCQHMVVLISTTKRMISMLRRKRFEKFPLGHDKSERTGREHYVNKVSKIPTASKFLTHEEFVVQGRLKSIFLFPFLLILSILYKKKKVGGELGSTINEN